MECKARQQFEAITVHSARGVTADTSHAVLGDTTARSLLYVAMTRDRDTTGTASGPIIGVTARDATICPGL